MDEIMWNFGVRYELSADGAGLLRYISQSDFYHIHSNEMTHLECFKHRSLTALKGKVRFCR